jgi:phosphoserine phosphatase RsbU/P
VPQYVREIEDQRRMQQEFEIARKIQTTMLCCKIPESPFLELASLCEPAYEVGGDYYDFIRFPYHSQNRIGVVIGDVSGKGVSAAFYMTLIKGILQTQAQVTPESTRTTLIRANDIFYDQVERNKFISMIYAIFDFEKGSVLLSRAGHNPLVIKKSEAADPETLTPKGMALGLAKGKGFSDFIEEVEIRFKGGDVFVFYTDGLSEAMNKKGDEYGEDRLYETIQINTHKPAKEILQMIYESVTAFVGKTPQHDDMTMIVVKIK